MNWATTPLWVLLAAMLTLHLWGTPASHESAELLLVLNVFFTTLVSMFIATLAGRTFLTSGRPALLAICIGMTVWGTSALVAVVGEHVGNYNLTIHNLGVAASGLSHLAGALAARRFGERTVREPGAWLSLGIALSFIAVGAIWMSTQEGWLPLFFIEGVGATTLRTVVLSVAIAMFVVAAGLTWTRFRTSGWRFLFWYSLGLMLIAEGALGLILQPTHGSLLGWVARTSQYLGGVYMLIGTAVTMRESGGWSFSLEARLLRSERARREQAEFIRTINDTTSELIFVKDLAGRLTYANAATLRLLGQTELPNARLDSEFFSVQAEHGAISENDREVIETGRVMEVEEIYTGVDGVQRTFLSTKSPLRDETGNIIGVVGVSRDLTERIEAREKLHHALEGAEAAGVALREADRRKDEFLAILAHELRNPLAPIRQAALISRAPNVTERQRQWSQEVIERQVSHMARLLDDLLDLSRITRGKFDIRKSQIELASIVDAAVEMARPLIDSRRHTLSIDVPREPMMLSADPLRLSQVIGNLLTNAAKYTEPGGQIDLKVEREGTDVRISVRDSGIGLASNSLESIFQMFVQVGTSLERSESGLGIGLALAKGLVTLHDGSIEARSDGIGKGSEFIVTLPLVRHVTPPLTAKAPIELNNHRGLHIVIADDNQDAAASLSTLLELKGFGVEVASDGESAWQLMCKRQPDVALLDIGMPKLNGYDLAKRVRETPWGKRIKLIAVTGWGFAEDRDKGIAAGFDRHYVKPIDTDALLRDLTPLAFP